MKYFKTNCQIGVRVYKENVISENALKEETKAQNINYILCKCERWETLQNKNIDKAFIRVSCKSHLSLLTDKLQ